jgi:hypothetical protein
METKKALDLMTNDAKKWNELRKTDDTPILIKDKRNLIIKECNLKGVTFTDCRYGSFTNC